MSVCVFVRARVRSKTHTQRFIWHRCEIQLPLPGLSSGELDCYSGVWNIEVLGSFPQISSSPFYRPVDSVRASFVVVLCTSFCDRDSHTHLWFGRDRKKYIFL